MTKQIHVKLLFIVISLFDELLENISKEISDSNFRFTASRLRDVLKPFNNQLKKVDESNSEQIKSDKIRLLHLISLDNKATLLNKDTEFLEYCEKFFTQNQ